MQVLFFFNDMCDFCCCCCCCCCCSNIHSLENLQGHVINIFEEVFMIGTVCKSDLHAHLSATNTGGVATLRGPSVWSIMPVLLKK